ncbi:hypothetical protein Fcan01_26828 [Folsomia candida]|uniref:Uncharacterized protein n=1 Tax=Folsomia candida TaxID=158441 RepID=A0A226D0T2_FOLCA|nr:hypothetical protein Fcan01_26828 [Folsomia candida]
MVIYSSCSGIQSNFPSTLFLRMDENCLHNKRTLKDETTSQLFQRVSLILDAIGHLSEKRFRKIGRKLFPQIIEKTLSSEVNVLNLELDLYRQTLIQLRVTNPKFFDEMNRLAYALHCLQWEVKNLDAAISQAGSRRVLYDQAAWSISHRAYLLRHDIRFVKAQLGIWVNRKSPNY